MCDDMCNNNLCCNPGAAGGQADEIWTAFKVVYHASMASSGI